MTRPAHARPNGPGGEPVALRDDVLLDAAHAGDAEALRALRERYRGTALAVARARTGSAEEAENVSAAALGRIEQVVGEGGGPRAFLGAFVVWMVGREADGGTRPVALPDDPAVPASLLRVFSGLPAEWQAFLWHTEILGHSARRAAAARGFGSVAAAGLHRDVFRGLRGLYVQASADRAAGPDCAEFSGELAHFVRGTRGQRSRWDVKEHLDGCARCTAEYLGRQDIGTGLRTWTLPVLAGLPLWGTEALELANLVAGADTGSGAAAGAVGAGAAAGAAAGPGDGVAAGAPWSGRSAKVLLGAGALATAVAVAAVGVSGGGNPVPVADSLAVEQAPRTAQDLEDQNGGDAPRGADRTDDGESGGGASDADLEQGSVRAGESTGGSTPADGPAGGLGGGTSSEAALVLADADDDLVVAAGAAGASEGSGDSSGGGGVRSAAAAERTAPDGGGARAAAAEAPGTASAGGPARTSSPAGSSTPTPPSERTADASTTAPTTASSPVPSLVPSLAPAPGTPSPVPSVRSTQPTVDAGRAPLKAPVAPAWTTAPPSAPERTGTTGGTQGQHTHPEVRTSDDRGGQHGSWHREQRGNDGRKGPGRDGRAWERAWDRDDEGGNGHRHGHGGDRGDRGHRGDRGERGASPERG